MTEALVARVRWGRRYNEEVDGGGESGWGEGGTRPWVTLYDTDKFVIYSLIQWQL